MLKHCFLCCRRNVNLNETHYSVGNMQAGNVKKVPVYDNQGFGEFRIILTLLDILRHFMTSQNFNNLNIIKLI